MKRIAFCLFLTVIFLKTNAVASEALTQNKIIDWQFDGMFGTFDRQSIQRGLKVYKEVCAACHSIKRVAFRNLQDIGFSEAEVKSIAASYQVKDGPNYEGEMFERNGRPSDHFPLVYPNEQAARSANNNALPPDQSLIIKARHDGANYIYSLLTGYQDAPEGVKISRNLYYNPFFAAGNSKIAMPPPLKTDGQVEYTDGTKPTVDQMAKDVVNFLHWCAEPEMEIRKTLGFQSLIFMLVFTVFFYFAMKRIWKKVK